jgi:hypothetical protein
VTHRASFVLSLCSALLIPLGARAQSEAPVAPPVEAPPADVAPAPEAPVAPSEAAPAPEAPLEEQKPAEAAPSDPAAPVIDPAAPATDPAAPALDPAAAPASDAPTEAFAPAAPVAQEPAPTPEPAPAPATPEPATPAPAEASATAAVTLNDKATAPVPTGDNSKDQEARCATLFAQGQTALAQAEGCASGEAPIYAGSQVGLTQLTAPASRTLPDSDNGFYALNLYLAPRFRLTERWAMFADVTLGYEATTPDFANERHEVVATDTRVQFSGVLGSLGGVNFSTGPRVIIPTSKPSWAANVIGGLGVSLSAVKNFDVLSGLAFQGVGVVTHVFSSGLTRKIREGEAPPCQATNGSGSFATECPAGNLRVVQDQFVAASSATLNIDDQWSAGLGYSYRWNLIKPFDDSVSEQVVIDTIGGPTVVDDIDENPIDDTRWRRSGTFSLSVNYQPAPWLFATLSGSTTVCYDLPYGSQGAFGGCSGGMKQSDWWLRNPIANKFTNVSLSLTVPIDAFVEAVTKGGADDKKTAKAKAKAKL